MDPIIYSVACWNWRNKIKTGKKGGGKGKVFLILLLTMQLYFKLLINEFSPSQVCFAYDNLSLSQPRSFPMTYFPPVQPRSTPLSCSVETELNTQYTFTWTGFGNNEICSWILGPHWDDIFPLLYWTAWILQSLMDERQLGLSCEKMISEFVSVKWHQLYSHPLHSTF